MAMLPEGMEMYFKNTPKKVFLGGTCNGSTWRDELIPMLKIDYFNPVVEEWTAEAQRIEELEKLRASHQLYVITPKMTGMFSIAEAVDMSNKNPRSLVFMVMWEDGEKRFDEHQKKSLQAVSELIRLNGGHVCYDLIQVANLLNKE